MTCCSYAPWFLLCKIESDDVTASSNVNYCVPYALVDHLSLE